MKKRMLRPIVLAALAAGMGLTVVALPAALQAQPLPSNQQTGYGVCRPDKDESRAPSQPSDPDRVGDQHSDKCSGQ